VAHGVAGGGGGGRTQLLATVEVLAMTVLTVSSPILFLVFSFSSSFFFSFSSLGYLLSIPILLLSSFSLFLFSALLFFALSSPVFRGKNRGERGRGGHCAVVPPTRGKLWASRGSVGVFLKGSQRLFEGEGGGKQENKTFFFPCFLHVQGKNKGYSTVQNGIVLGSLFFFNSV
jgi:hypothetical protein